MVRGTFANVRLKNLLTPGRSRPLAHGGAAARQGGGRHGAPPRRDERPVSHAGGDRYAAGAAVLPARRDSGIRPETTAPGESLESVSTGSAAAARSRILRSSRTA